MKSEPNYENIYKITNGVTTTPFMLGCITLIIYLIIKLIL